MRFRHIHDIVNKNPNSESWIYWDLKRNIIQYIWLRTFMIMIIWSDLMRSDLNWLHLATWILIDISPSHSDMRPPSTPLLCWRGEGGGGTPARVAVGRKRSQSSLKPRPSRTPPTPSPFPVPSPSYFSTQPTMHNAHWTIFNAMHNTQCTMHNPHDPTNAIISLYKNYVGFLSIFHWSFSSY